MAERRPSLHSLSNGESILQPQASEFPVGQHFGNQDSSHSQVKEPNCSQLQYSLREASRFKDEGCNTHQKEDPNTSATIFALRAQIKALEKSHSLEIVASITREEERAKHLIAGLQEDLTISRLSNFEYQEALKNIVLAHDKSCKDFTQETPESRLRRDILQHKFDVLSIKYDLAKKSHSGDVNFLQTKLDLLQSKLDATSWCSEGASLLQDKLDEMQKELHKEREAHAVDVSKLKNAQAEHDTSKITVNIEDTQQVKCNDYLLKVGISVRLRFLETCKSVRCNGQFVNVLGNDYQADRAVIENGDNVIYGGNVAADVSLFRLGILNQRDHGKLFTAIYNGITLEHPFKYRWGTYVMWMQNMGATIASCGSFTDYTLTKYLDDQVLALKTRCGVIQKAIREKVEREMEHEPMKRKSNRRIALFESNGEVQRACGDMQVIVTQIFLRFKRQNGG